jgi:hypothetical protein
MPQMMLLPAEVAHLFAPPKLHFRYATTWCCAGQAVAHLVCFEKATLQALAHHTSTRVAA